MWYNRQAVHERQRRSLKIEQQEISTKQKQKSAKYESRQLKEQDTQKTK